MSPELSIIIVNWNTCALLKACLRSIHARAGVARWEVIVVDNGSTDASPAMVRSRFPSVILIRNDVNRGFAAANNQGLQLARGRFVLLLNSDTEILGSAIEDSLAYMERQTEVGVMGVRVLNPDRSLQLTCFRYPSLVNMTLLMVGAHRLSWPRFFGRDRMRDWLRRDERDVDVVSGCYFMTRRETVDDVGLFDEQFFFYDEETDWCVRARASGWAVRLAPVGEIVHHGGASSVNLDDHRALLFAESRVRLHRKYGGRLAAAIAWWILAASSLVRAAAFGLHGVLTANAESRRAAGRFARAARTLVRAWPADHAARVPDRVGVDPAPPLRHAA